MRNKFVSMMGLWILGPMAVVGLTMAQGGAAGAQQPARGGGRGGGIITLTVTSTSFPDGGEIPAKYTGQGVSPQLSWTGAPAATATYVLIMHDVDVAIPAGNLTGDISHTRDTWGRTGGHPDAVQTREAG